MRGWSSRRAAPTRSRPWRRRSAGPARAPRRRLATSRIPRPSRVCAPPPRRDSAPSTSWSPTPASPAPRRWRRVELAEWNRLFAVNATGPFLCAQAFVPGMVARRWGRIINVASIAGRTGAPYISAYASTKHAVVGFTRVAGRRARRQGDHRQRTLPRLRRHADDRSVRRSDRGARRRHRRDGAREARGGQPAAPADHRGRGRFPRRRRSATSAPAASTARRSGSTAEGSSDETATGDDQSARRSARRADSATAFSRRRGAASSSSPARSAGIASSASRPAVSRRSSSGRSTTSSRSSRGRRRAGGPRRG